METGKLIPLHSFCTHHHVESEFINELSHFGLIEIVTIEDNSFIDEEKLTELEKLVRLHQELDINLEGMDAITHLLQRLNEMQHEIRVLKNKLRLYEDTGDD
ncbi:MAG TPA: chaperone modulator CbpM [Ferruginibacter sp.]|nr:chaperone modulator CbpM [Ferruginibacter sp.]